MLNSNIFKSLKKNTNLFKLNKYNFSKVFSDADAMGEDDLQIGQKERDTIENFKRKQQGMIYLQKINLKEQDREMLRKIQELHKQRLEDLKKNNKEFVLKTKVPGIKDQPDK